MVDIPIGQFNALISVKDDTPVCNSYTKMTEAYDANPSIEHEMYIDGWRERSVDENDMCGCEPTIPGLTITGILNSKIDVEFVNHYFDTYSGLADTVDEFDAIAREEGDLLQRRAMGAEREIENRDRTREVHVAL